MQNATKNASIVSFAEQNVKHKVNIAGDGMAFCQRKETCKMRLAYGVDAQLHCVPRPWMPVKMNLNVFIDVESGKWNNKIKQRNFRAEAIVKWKKKGWDETGETGSNSNRSREKTEGVKINTHRPAWQPAQKWN